jgi:hypothetical protein
MLFDGHYWIERDGEVIDPNFDEYDKIKKINGCIGKRVYLKANQIVTAVMLKKLTNRRNEINADPFTKSIMFGGYWKPQFGCCSNNVLMEYQKNGGEIVFGSMGWKKKNGGIYYEFGGENWTIAQFLKKA